MKFLIHTSSKEYSVLLCLIVATLPSLAFLYTLAIATKSPAETSIQFDDHAKELSVGKAISESLQLPWIQLKHCRNKRSKISIDLLIF